MKPFFTILECITIVLSLILVTVQLSEEVAHMKSRVECIA